MSESESEIERLVEAQARGEHPQNADVQVESTPLPAAELDTRRSKSALGAGLILGEVGSSVDPGSSNADPLATPGDAQPAAEPTLDGVKDSVPESGPAVIDRQDLALARNLPIPSDEELGLIFERNTG